MPIYEYECPTCGRFEVIQKISEKTLEECPQCKEKGRSEKVTKAVSASSFHLKGTGWYKTDYTSTGGVSPKSPTTGKADASSSTSTDGGTTAKTGESSGGSSDGGTEVKKGSCGSGCGCH